LTDKRVMIKICGMSRKEDVEFAVELGVDCLGFILAQSKRQVDLEKVKKLTEDLPPFISRSAVVVNPSIKELDNIIESRLFDYIQFHGSEDPALIEEMPLKTVKALSIAAEEDLDEIEKYRYSADFMLFDTKLGQKIGGTGRAFDWQILEKYSFNDKFILAGGLGPDNIEAALKALNPAAVDLNSRLEISPGIKDHLLMEAAVSQIKRY